MQEGVPRSRAHEVHSTAIFPNDDGSTPKARCMRAHLKLVQEAGLVVRTFVMKLTVERENQHVLTLLANVSDFELWQTAPSLGVELLDGSLPAGNIALIM